MPLNEVIELQSQLLKIGQIKFNLIALEVLPENKISKHPLWIDCPVEIWESDPHEIGDDLFYKIKAKKLKQDNAGNVKEDKPWNYFYDVIEIYQPEVIEIDDLVADSSDETEGPTETSQPYVPQTRYEKGVSTGNIRTWVAHAIDNYMATHDGEMPSGEWLSKYIAIVHLGVTKFQKLETQYPGGFTEDAQLFCC